MYQGGFRVPPRPPPSSHFISFPLPEDAIVYYSPKKTMGGTELVQAFTAIGIVANDEIAAVGDSEPCMFRRKVDFASAVDAPIRPLIEQLSFIRDKARWGGVFRFGLVEIPKTDFVRIAAAMEADLP